MSVQPRVTRVATSWPGNFVVDDLVVPLIGGNPVDIATITGSLRVDLLSTAYAVTVLTFFFAPQTLQAGLSIVPSIEIGTSNFKDVAVDAIDLTAQSFGIRFRDAAGAASTPPPGNENTKLHLAIFRPLPFR